MIRALEHSDPRPPRRGRRIGRPAGRLAVLAAALAVLLALGPAGPAGAMMSDDREQPAPRASTSVDPSLAEGRAAIERQDWNAAVAALTDYVRKSPNNADAFNYLGFAQRNLGDYDAAFAAYGRALEIDPDHRGAHEYVGEAYLKTGNLAKAEEHLARLDRLCVFGCAEYSALRDAVAAYRAAQGS